MLLKYQIKQGQQNAASCFFNITVPADVMFISDKVRGAAFVVIFILSFLRTATACFSPQTVNWTGNVNSDWNNSANYDLTPGNNDRIVIDPANYTGVAANPVISSNSSYKPNKVEVYNGGSLTIGADLTLKAYIFTASHFLVDGAGTNTSMNAGTVNISYLSAHQNLDIQNGGSFDISGGNLFANTVNVQTGSQLGISGGLLTLDADFLLSGTANFSSGNLTLAGNFTNNGVYNHTGGLIEFNGTGAQTIDGASTFYNMTINNTGSGVSLNTGLHNLQGVLTLTNGAFNTNNALTVLSNGTGTGSIAAITAGSINGTVTMQRSLMSGPDGWRLLSSPISSMTLQDWNDDFITSGFTGSDYPNFNFYSIWTYDETKFGVYDTGFVHATNITNPIGTGQGFWCYIGPLPTVIDVTGNIISGPVNFNISYTPNAGPAEDGWNLVGNPYPSTIDWDSPNWTKTNMANAIYIWNPQNQQWAAYVGGIGTNGGSNLIASSQGFLVQATGASPTLTIQENCKSAVDAAFIKSSNNVPSSFSLTIERNNVKDETFFCFNQNGTAGFDPFLDAWKIFSNGNVPSLSSIIQDSLDLSINTMSALSSDYLIPVRAKTFSSGQHIISIHGLDNMPPNACITLEDTYFNLFTDLKTDSLYAFNLSDTTAYPRFLLHLSFPGILQANDATCGQPNGYAIGQGAGNGPWDYIWKDSIGTIIQQHTGIYTKDTLSGLTAGMYVLNVSGNTNFCGGTVTDTFYIGNTPAISVIANVQDVGCYGDSNGAIMLTLSGGMPPYHIQWQNGDTALSLSGLASGFYSVTITDQTNCSFTDSFFVNSPAEIQASFAFSDDTVYLSQGGSVDFINYSTGASSYYWEFGDGNYSSDSNPSHSYSVSGIFTVMLVALHEQCSDTVKKYLTVLNNPGTSELSHADPLQIYSDGTDIYIHPDIANTGNALIVVTDEIGKKVYFKNRMLDKEIIDLNIPCLKNAVYCVSVYTSSGGVYLQKLAIANR